MTMQQQKTQYNIMDYHSYEENQSIQLSSFVEILGYFPFRSICTILKNVKDEIAVKNASCVDYKGYVLK